MPILSSDYQPPFLIFKNGDVSTIFASVFRKVRDVSQSRERIVLNDGDFLDLDWSYSDSKTDRLIIICHGLEGNAQRPYILGTAKHFNNNGYDCCAINYRGCSGEVNQLFTSYHSGKTEDLESVIHHILKKYHYSKIILKGFSLGGNLVLKYIGENSSLPVEIKAAIAISTPIDLESCMIELLKKRNLIYHKNFLKTLKVKLYEKSELFPNTISLEKIKSIKSLWEYDDIYTSRFNGYQNATHYYQSCSSTLFLKDIKLPTLIINAENDSFLSNSCYPREIAKNSEYIYLETPKYGGHVSFIDQGNIYYNEKKSLEFLENIIS